MLAKIYLSLPLKETDLVQKLREKYGDGRRNTGSKISFIGESIHTKRRMEIELDLKNSIMNIIYHEGD